uniref:DNA repair protein XRCC1 n=1 Tax=Scleropages formosus TaxID=113540 RepID=A0A8C9SG09_SCLFO
MPEIKLKHVVSCSSEDSTHKAENLLSSDTYRKWKSARPGEKQTSVILQFEKEEQVHSIDIGNDGSAFVEVLVGHSTSVKDQDYEVLLVTSSFMSPSESRNGTNTNRVRFFGPNQLVKATAQEKWDRVKIVCTQPYSKSIAYGIAFVKFHSPPDDNEPPSKTSPKLTKLGQFRVKEETVSTGSTLQPGSLFFNRESVSKASASPKVSPPNEKLSYAAAALQSSSPSHYTPASSSTQLAPVLQCSPLLSSPLICLILFIPPSFAFSPASAVQKTHGPNKRESRVKPEPKPKAKSTEAVPMDQILEGVVFVLSGFQNPFRGELRDKALAMGAKYRPDWTPDATHLICAFANTPKYSQVKASGGIIVRKEWVLDSWYLLQPEPYSFFCIMAQKKEKRTTPTVKQEDQEEDEYGGSTDVDDPGHSFLFMEFLWNFPSRAESQCRQSRTAQDVSDKGEDAYGGSTDENTDAEAEEDKPIPELPDFLTGKHFFFYGKFPLNERRLLLRYIIAFNGTVEEYMNEKVQFVITAEGWHNSFEDALMENSSLSFVKPSWIFAINDRQKMLPYQPYTVVP